MAKKPKHQIETLLSHFAEDRQENQGAVVPPIFQNSLFTFDSWDAIDAAFDDRVENPIYTRGANPTVKIVEEKIAVIAKGERAKLFASGMGAISAAVLHFMNPGEHIITVRNLYGPANNFLNRFLKEKMNIETTFISGTVVADFEAAIRDNTRLIYLESPTSAVFSLQDIAAIAALARSRSISTMIDNSWASPIFQLPLTMGIDLEVHSCSKYLGGHSDIVAGVLIGSDALIRSIATKEYELLGAKMAPFEAWLLLRSLRTLPMRMARHQENAAAVVDFLTKRGEIAAVNYPGLTSHPQYQLARKQMLGFSGLLSFTLATNELTRIKKFVNSLQVFRIGVSWGGHESLVYAPAISYLKELPPERFKEMGISTGDIRISVGLETASDLIDDLAQAFDKSGIGQ